MTIYYLRLEGVNFGYVLCDTDQLSVVRGASLLLRQAVKDVALRCGKLEPLATGASTGLFRQILSITLFEKLPLQQAFPGNDYKMLDGMPCTQLNLFAF